MAIINVPGLMWHLDSGAISMLMDWFVMEGEKMGHNMVADNV